MSRITAYTLVITAALALAAPSAFAATASQSAYSGIGGETQNNVGPQTQVEPTNPGTQVVAQEQAGNGQDPVAQASRVTPVDSSTGDSLPFTGLDLALVASLGLLLVAGGMGLSRLVAVAERQ